jgi:hypothetical protein
MIGRVILMMVLATAWSAAAAKAKYQPPVTVVSKAPPEAYFGQMAGTKKWCAIKTKKWKALADRGDVESDEFGWVRFS